jgi:cytochrome c oxidase subunit 2
MSFQDPATVVMNSLIDLHHDIMFFLLLIITFVGFFMIRILQLFLFKPDDQLPSDLTHNTFIEII